MHVRAAMGTGIVDGYEAQANNSSSDPRLTGSLFAKRVGVLHTVTKQLIPDDTWWTQHVVMIGNRLVVLVNNKVLTDFTDHAGIYQSGYVALQQYKHARSQPGGMISYRNVMVRRLPSDERQAWDIVKKDLQSLSLPDTP